MQAVIQAVTTGFGAPVASVAPAFGATTGGFGATTSQPSTGMFGAPAPAFGATTGGFGAATSQVSCQSCPTSCPKAVFCSLEDCSAPLVNPPPSGQPTPHQGSGDLEHRQTSNLTRTSDSSELLTIRTSRPLASEDSGSQLQVLRQHSDQQGALEQPQVR